MNTTRSQEKQGALRLCIRRVLNGLCESESASQEHRARVAARILKREEERKHENETRKAKEAAEAEVRAKMAQQQRRELLKRVRDEKMRAREIEEQQRAREAAEAKERQLVNEESMQLWLKMKRRASVVADGETGAILEQKFAFK